MWQRLTTKRPWQQLLLQHNPRSFLRFLSKKFLTSQFNSPLSIISVQTTSLDGGRRSKRIRPSTPGGHDSAFWWPPISGHRESHYQILGALSWLWRKKKSGCGQPWECFSCQSGKLNELVMERKMPYLFKPRLDPGCLIVPSCFMNPSQPGFNCPVRADWLATQARQEEGQLLFKLDLELSTGKPMSSGCVSTDAGPEPRCPCWKHAGHIWLRNMHCI